MRDVYNEILGHFATDPDVELPGTKGAQGLKYAGKMFAMFYKGDLTVRLPESRVRELIDSGEGLPHDPGTGKPMKDRVLIPAEAGDTWIRLCAESLDFVRS